MISAEKYSPVIFDKYLKDYRSFKVNSSEYFQFWKEQKQRMLHGYKPTNGEWIPGNYYFYLNFSKIHGLTPGAKRKTMISPLYRDQDHEYYLEVHWAKHGDGKDNKGGYGIIVLKARRKGFSQPNSSLIETPNGQVFMGDIKTNDFVLGKNGKPNRVLQIHPQGKKKVFEVKLRDGRIVECSEDHLWTVIDFKGNIKTHNTKRLSEVKLIKNIGKNNQYYHWHIELPEAVEYSEKEFSLHPYLVGYFLGDGTATKSTVGITTADVEVIVRLEEIIPDDCVIHQADSLHYTIKSRKLTTTKNCNSVMKSLRDMGIACNGIDKFIPEEYLYGSIYQRMELLKGLMDSDGTSSPNGAIRFVTTSDKLKDSFVRLVSGLGIRFYVGKVKHEEKRDCWVISLTTNKNVFNLERKSKNIRTDRKQQFNKIPIISITDTGKFEEQTCITVESDDHLYLANNYIPTHNSFMNANILLHEWTCYPHSENGLGAQKEDYVQDFRKKMLLSYNELPSKLQNKILHNNEELFMSGYKEKENGIWMERGTKSMIHFRVMEKPNAFRGTSMNYMVFEEAGEFLKLKRSFQSSEDCFKEGDQFFGTPIIGGTSNNMEVESDDYMNMYYNAELFNLKPVFIKASKVFGSFFDMSTGKSDVLGAEAFVNAESAKRKASGDLASYYSYLQENPLLVEHAFYKSGKTPFDLEKINRQIVNITTNNQFNRVQNGRLEWAKNKEGKEIFGSKPVFITDFQDKANGYVVTLKDNEEEPYPIEIVEQPLEGIKNAHLAAVDPYHVDDELEEMKKKASDQKDRSKGSMCVYRRFVSQNVIGELPVAFYTDRPYSKEKFYENCLMLAILYDSQILVEYNDDGFLKYFISHNMTKYLKERPRSADSPFSQATNKYGIHMKNFQKKLLTELVDEYIKKHWEDIYFLKLLNEFTVYGVRNTDRVMSFGMALIHDMDATKKVIKSSDDLETKKMDGLPGFERDSNGVVTVKINDKIKYDNNSKQNITFDYNLDNE